jgi:hypothetical protein
VATSGSKSDVGLGNVDNTSDANKPVSTATQTALNAKAPLASPVFTGNPTAPTPTVGDNDTSLATTAFVQTALTGLSTPAAVRVATTGGFALTGIPASANTDSVTVVNGDRVLVQNQGVVAGNAYDNGVYVVNSAGAWSRATDADTTAKLVGAQFRPTEGAFHKGQVFQSAVQSTDVLGTTALGFYSTSSRIETAGVFGQPGVTPNDAGTAYFVTGERRLMVWNGTVWENTKGVQTYGSTAPTFPAVGEFWADASLSAIGSALAAPDVQIFTASGTWTMPAGALTVVIEVLGGGGAGGGAGAAPSGTNSRGSGGGAGGYAWAQRLASALGGSVAITVGAGGLGNLAANGDPGSGSSFGSELVVGGGSGGIYNPSNSVDYWVEGADGGTATAGDLLVPGQPGEGSNGDGILGSGGGGGSSKYGSGGKRRGSGASAQALAGYAASGYGAGGGGALNTAVISSGNRAGGSGSSGLVVVTTYFQ